MSGESDRIREKTMQRRGLLFLIVTGLSVVSPEVAYAYLDPGGGSMLLQLLLGGAAGLVVLIKLSWQRLLLVFGVNQEEEPVSEEAPTPQQE